MNFADSEIVASILNEKDSAQRKIFEKQILFFKYLLHHAKKPNKQYAKGLQISVK